MFESFLDNVSDGHLEGGAGVHVDYLLVGAELCLHLLDEFLMMVVATGDLPPGAWSLTDDALCMMRLGSKGSDRATPCLEEIGWAFVVVHLHSVLEDFVCDVRAVSAALVLLDAGRIHLSN